MPRFNPNWYEDSKSEVEKTFLQENLKRFDQQRSPEGKPWAPRKQEYPWKTLNKTSQMRNSLKYELPEMGKVSMSFERKGIFHQFGTSKMPARPWAGVTSKTWIKVKRIYLKNLFKGFRIL